MCCEKYMNIILYISLFLTLGIPVLVFGLYGLILLYYYRKKSKIDESNGDTIFEPTVSVVIATHDEELVIGKKIENVLSSNYPLNKLELILVDDSTDSTPEIIREYSKKYSNIQLISFNERVGYSPSMIAGCKAANGEIIVLNDAGSFLDKEAIPNLVAKFVNPKVGVVTGNDILMNTRESGGNSESIYLKFLDFQRTAETKMDSTFFIKSITCVSAPPRARSGTMNRIFPFLFFFKSIVIISVFCQHYIINKFQIQFKTSFSNAKTNILHI